jgi:PmbA protein
VHFSNSYIDYQTWHGTTAWIGCTAIATAQGQRREGSFFDRKRTFRDLEIPSRVGERAGQRALAKLGAAPRPSAKAPVVFDPETAGAFLAGLFGAFDAAQVLEQRSYLAGRMGQKITSPLLTIVDDGLMRRGLGTAPFDGEGVECHRTVVVDRGVLANFLNTSVSARRMGVPPTGNGIRTYEALPAAGPTNFYIESGGTTLDKMIKDVPDGLLVTGTAGFGFDLVAGEYSQQVEGQWITNGALAGSVEGMTVAGKLDDLLGGIDAVGNRLEFRARVCSPALRFREMAIGGV